MVSRKGAKTLSVFMHAQRIYPRLVHLFFASFAASRKINIFRFTGKQAYEISECADEHHEDSDLVKNGSCKNSRLTLGVSLRMNISHQRRCALRGPMAFVTILLADAFFFTVSSLTLMAPDAVESGIIPAKILFLVGANLQ